jgi:hypothetical protein
VSGDRLPVHINREELHGLEVPAAFEATGSFDIALRNHGEALHVHLHLDDSLSQVAAIDASNHYIEAETERPVRVTVHGDARPIHGKLKVVSAYGAQTRYVDVELEEGEAEKDPVEVDESLSKPQADPAPEPDGPLDIVADSPELVVLALAAFTLVAIGAIAVTFDGIVVVFGALAALVTVLGVMYVLFADE